MTRFEKTYNWLKPIFERLIEIQETNGIVVDCMKIVGKLGIDEKTHMIYEQIGSMKSIYYGDGWTDEETETKAYWRKTLKDWRVVMPESMQKVDLK
jgi:hypothetical protein